MRVTLEPSNVSEECDEVVTEVKQTVDEREQSPEPDLPCSGESSQESTQEVDGRPSKRQRGSVGDKDGGDSQKHSSSQSLSNGSTSSFSRPDTSVDDDECYPMSSKPYRGLLLLINNVDFKPESGMHKCPRLGSDQDAEGMKSLFEELGFKVEIKRNLTVMSMRRAFLDVIDRDFSNLSAFACCILSHGEHNVLYGTDGKIEIREITNYFVDNKLAGKPKLFFFQACQGNRYMESLKHGDGNEAGNDAMMDEVDGPPENTDITLPAEADFLYAYSTVPGYYAWRDNKHGSWFIQAVCEVFRRHAHKMDVVRMLTKVNRKVATKKSNVPNNGYANGKRQIPSIVSQLRMDFFFNSGPLNPYTEMPMS